MLSSEDAGHRDIPSTSQYDGNHLDRDNDGIGCEGWGAPRRHCRLGFRGSSQRAGRLGGPGCRWPRLQV
ncbi:excalibur calcium-binding domain-containing protein [Mycolicibacterium chubuense]|uniref:excalibur calcium-binding domain-containing protein n=1 Tax=Mycolicibacterium chubuense TaxID=1800 RepID=UPI0012FF29C9